MLEAKMEEQTAIYENFQEDDKKFQEITTRHSGGRVSPNMARVSHIHSLYSYAIRLNHLIYCTRGKKLVLNLN